MLHRSEVVSDDDELRGFPKLGEHGQESADVGFVERSVDLVQETKRRRFVTEDGEHDGDRGHRLLPSGEKQHVLKFLPGRLRNDIDAALQYVVLVDQS